MLIFNIGQNNNHNKRNAQNAIFMLQKCFF